MDEYNQQKAQYDELYKQYLSSLGKVTRVSYQRFLTEESQKAATQTLRTYGALTITRGMVVISITGPRSEEVFNYLDSKL